ncbi:hypothetical protein M758_8G028400 [Ceratodon purpureus]|nr:hypothetical protein M758_8G028400 [Ceratodon purpureus]
MMTGGTGLLAIWQWTVSGTEIISAPVSVSETGIISVQSEIRSLGEYGVTALGYDWVIPGLYCSLHIYGTVVK